MTALLKWVALVLATVALLAARGDTSLVRPAQAANSNAAPHGTVYEAKLPSTVMGGEMPFLIYVPPGYDDLLSTFTRYPVVYLLHGAPGDYRNWFDDANADQVADRLINGGQIPPMILVMPEGHCGWIKDSEWSDGTPPAEQAETYLIHEVVPYIDTHYRTLTDRAHRAIGGLSTGGYAGVNITIHHPELFSTAWSLSGNYSAATTLLHQPVFRTPALAAANAPLRTVAQLSDPQQIHVYLDVGKTDTLDNTNIETQQMEQALTAAGVPHRVNYFDGGHTWDYWREHLADALRYVAANLPGA